MTVNLTAEVKQSDISQLDYTYNLLTGPTDDEWEAVQAVAIAFLKKDRSIKSINKGNTDILFQAQTEDQLIARIDKSLEQIKEGKFQDADEFVKELYAEIDAWKFITSISPIMQNPISGVIQLIWRITKKAIRQQEMLPLIFRRRIKKLEIVAGSLRNPDSEILKFRGLKRINFLRHDYFLLYRIEEDQVFVTNIFHSSEDFENKLIWLFFSKKTTIQQSIVTSHQSPTTKYFFLLTLPYIPSPIPYKFKPLKFRRYNGIMINTEHWFIKETQTKKGIQKWKNSCLFCFPQ